MSEGAGKLHEVVCPCCRAVIWVEAATGIVVKTEKAAKVKESLDELLLKEKKKKDGFETKFEATAELEKKKRELAQDRFARAFGKIDEEKPR
jgi:hypothetical protein